MLRFGSVLELPGVLGILRLASFSVSFTSFCLRFRASGVLGIVHFGSFGVCFSPPEVLGILRFGLVLEPRGYLVYFVLAPFVVGFSLRRDLVYFVSALFWSPWGNWYTSFWLRLYLVLAYEGIWYTSFRLRFGASGGTWYTSSASVLGLFCTKYYSDRTTSIQYCSVLQRTTKYFWCSFSRTFPHSTPSQHFSTTLLHKTCPNSVLQSIITRPPPNKNCHWGGAVGVELLDMQEQIIRGLKSANKGSLFSVCSGTFCQSWLFANHRVEIILGHDVRIKVVFDYECPLLEPRILTNPHMIQTGHIWFFQLAVCFWVLGLPLFWVKLGADQIVRHGMKLCHAVCQCRRGMVIPELVKIISNPKSNLVF